MPCLMQNDALKFAIYLDILFWLKLSKKKRQMQNYASMNLVSGELVADYIL